MRGLLVAVGLATALVKASVPVQSGAPTCAQLISLTLPDTTISSAEDVAAGPLTPSSGGRGVDVPRFCRLSAIAAPTSDSRIAIEIWMPTPDKWNDKLLGTDNGGFSGAIGYAAMASAVSRGYAAAGTDTGHSGDQMEFGRAHPEKIVDWAYRAIHLTAEVAKLVVRDHYGRFPEHSYFSGCSTGGQQALSEVQRYPHDYDGVVAGDPGNNRLRLIFGFLWSWIATHTSDGAPLLTPAKLALLTKSAVAACDAHDGLRDGIIGDPRECHFDPAVLQCSDATDNDSCLTAPQVAAVKKVYDGAHNEKTGELLFRGWARGSEQGWPPYITAPREPVRIGLFRDFVFHDPGWDWRTFDWDKDVAYVEAQVPYLSAVSHDLRAFNARGGKIVMYTGLADPVVPPEDTIDYYEAVARASGGMRATQKFFRFFPVPGMAHCGGGVGPNTFDALGALEQWVEHGSAPARIVASHSTAGRVDLTRPLCPYPLVARYTGSGSTDDAANFSCVARTAGGSARPPS